MYSCPLSSPALISRKATGVPASRKGLKPKGCPCSSGKEMQLPIYDHENTIIQSILENQVTIIAGATGSGKSTGLPQIILRFIERMKEKGLTKIIGITQPRKVAASSIAEFVAKELGYKCGEEVGYKIRFDDSTNEGTMVKLMTEGILLRELELDYNLSKYSVIIVDEAHERGINMDFLLGVLKDLLKRRDDIRVIISSATMEEQKFSDFFDGAPIIKIKGKPFPVKIIYDKDSRFYAEHFPDVVRENVLKAIKKIQSFETEGDIVVFMTGEDEILEMVKEIRKKIPGYRCLPLFGKMPFEEQMRIFQESSKPTIIVSTNIAQTSLTVKKAVYVIDTGYVKQADFNPQTGIGSLKVVQISKADAKQRTGRVGRTSPGICYRLYSEKDYNLMDEFTVPEIKRTNLARVILQMKIMGIKDIEGFSFIDQPDKESIHVAHEDLIILGALDRNNGVTEVGRKMASMPVDPKFSRMVIAAEKYGCLDQVLGIVSNLSAKGNVFYRPREDEKELRKAEKHHRKFWHKESDFLTILNVYDAFCQAEDKREFCSINYLNFKTLEEMGMIKAQLIEILGNGVTITSSTDSQKITKAIGSGLVQNICRAGRHHEYTKDRQTVYIHPGSVLFRNSPEWIIASEIRTTKRPYAINCSLIKKEWIPEIAPQLCRRRIRHTSIDKDKGSTTAVEKLSYNNWTISEKERIFELEEAEADQEERIAQAKRDGWLRLSFTRNNHNWECELGGQIYQASTISNIEPRKEYYCSVYQLADDLYYKLTKIRIVNVEFEVKDFG